MYPLKMKPEFKELIWGGDNLRKIFNKEIPSDKTAESWEVACHKNGSSYVANGDFSGRKLSDVIEEYPNEIMGSLFCKGLKFPLLFKVLDANSKLSVQVHPNDDFAEKYENGELGKTEMWYVLEAKEGSKLVFGFKNGVNKDVFKNAIDDGKVEDCLNYVKVKKGDIFFINAGTVHAIGDGIVIAEMQQNSDTTYRVYDYNRVGADGKMRELHIDKALKVSDFSSKTGKEKVIGASIMAGNTKVTFAACCDYFSMDVLDIEDKFEIVTEDSVNIIFFAEGSGEIIYDGGTETFEKGDTFVIPASLREYAISGKCKVLNSYIEDVEQKIETLKSLGISDNDIKNIGGLNDK